MNMIFTLGAADDLLVWSGGGAAGGYLGFNKIG